MEEWLKKRLTPSKQKITRWSDLAEILEALWGLYYDPEISRTQRLRSSYTAEDQDLFKKIREMGDYFSYDLPKQEDRPVSLAWRRLELEYKDVEFIVKSALRRHFGDFPCTWYPLFAKINKPYGSEYVVGDYLTNESDKNIPTEGYFLTSRGILGINKRGLFVNGISKDEFKERSYPVIMRTKPLHIVFDGYLWFLKIENDEFAATLPFANLSEQAAELQFTVNGTRFDYFPADADRLDTDVLGIRRAIGRNAYIDFPEKGHLAYDAFLLLNNAFADRVPLDIIILESAASLESLFYLLYRESVNRNEINISKILADKARREVLRYYDILQTYGFQFEQGTTHRNSILAFPKPRRYRLDHFFLDGMLADFIPLDIVQTVQGTDFESPFYLLYRESVNRNEINISKILADKARREVLRYYDILQTYGFQFEQGTTHRNSILAFPKPRRYRLDHFFLDGMLADFIPLDIVQTVQGTDFESPFYLLYRESVNKQAYKLQGDLNTRTEVTKWCNIASDINFDYKHITERTIDVIKFYDERSTEQLDRIIHDGIFTDKLPADLSSNNSILTVLYKESVRQQEYTLKNVESAITLRTPVHVSKIAPYFSIENTTESTHKSSIAFIGQENNLDEYIRDGQADNIPLDTIVRKHFSLIHKEVSKDATFVLKDAEIRQDRKTSHEDTLIFSTDAKTNKNITRNVVLSSFENKEYGLDQLMYLDDFSADSGIPLDLTGGYM